MMLSFGNKLLLLATDVAVYLLSWRLGGGARCCCDCRSLAVLAILSLVGACFCCLLLFTCCLGAAVYCCCCYCSLIIAVLVMQSLGKLVKFTAAVAIYLLLSWRLLGVRFCCCCRSFTVLLMFYRISLVLSAAAASIYYCWLSWLWRSVSVSLY
ncbi:hypothetical protein MAM1_0147d06571 [Mucor ambiguus]|uniref:Uncharacterized protein n=1 Tax=Mucor ambiguus TaxID=91626 RepID=A0A0C9M9F2_9FUNG|nr:hypothetical protein MAM1_0147d06571 [Mucor ambiguus]